MNLGISVMQKGVGEREGSTVSQRSRHFEAHFQKSKLKRTVSPQQIDRLMNRAVKRMQSKVWIWGGVR